MVAKIIPGNNFQKAIDYIQAIYKKDKDARLIMHSKGIFLTDNKSIASVLDSYAGKGGNRPNEPVLHVSVNFHPKDAYRITDAFARHLLSVYMKEMGYDETEYVIYRHSDKEHPHFHILLCAVDRNGKKINRSNERIRNRDRCRSITEKYGLYISSGKESVNRDRLRGKDAAKYAMFDIIKEAKESCQDWKEFNDMLKSRGITMKFHYNNTTGNILGVMFCDGTYSMSGSKIDKSLSLNKLMEVFGDFREIVHESIHFCYDRYQQRLAQLNSGNIYGRGFFTMLRHFPYWDDIFPDGMPCKFDIPYPSVQSLLSLPEYKPLESDILTTDNGKTSYVGLTTLLVILMQPYGPQMSICGGGSTSKLPWRDLDDDERWRYRFKVDPSIYPRNIKPRYIKSKPIVTPKRR